MRQRVLGTWFTEVVAVESSFDWHMIQAHRLRPVGPGIVTYTVPPVAVWKPETETCHAVELDS